MDASPRFVDEVKRHGWASKNFAGFLHVLIGRRITHQADGEVVSSGLTWRELAALLKKVRWDPEAVRELGLEPKALPPRDRERYWYVAITRAGVDSTEALKAGDVFAELLRQHGYDVSRPAGS